MATLASSLAKASMGADRYVVGPCRSSTSSSSSWSSSSCSSSGSSSPCSSTSSSSSSGITTEEEDKNSSSSSSWNSSESSESSSLTDISTAKKKKKKDNKEVNKTKKKKRSSSSIKKMKNLKNLKRESNKKKEKNKSKSMAVVVVDRKKKKKKHIKSTAHEENGDDVSSMLLLGAELLKEVEEAAAAAAAASSSSATAVVSVNPMEESRTWSTNHRPLLLPIGHYVTQTGADSRSHLLEQVMSSVPAAQWQAILPPVLKEMNSTELKQLCLQQLQLLTDSAILNIINGDQGDQGATGSTGKGILSSEMAIITATGVKEKLKKKKSKKSKKSKKKSEKAKKTERLLLVKEKKPIDDVAAEESSGKTLMELLELEMRARAIKALLKKEEEGIEDDEWSDHVSVPSATLPVENDAIQRPMKAATESGVGRKHHRPNSPTIQSTLIQRTESTSDESNRRGRRPSSDAVRHRHYRHHHHPYRQDRSRSPILARREVDLSVVKTEPPASSSTNLNKSSTPPRSPLLIEATDDTPTIQVGRINSEESKRIDDEDKSGDDRRTTQVVVEEEEEVEYEEEGIQEVDIELGSGSDDDAHSSCR